MRDPLGDRSVYTISFLSFAYTNILTASRPAVVAASHRIGSLSLRRHACVHL
ncbi:MAG: hypothetical protein IPK82_28735 [Polyangiaceae bacterium]|nr:hypothetical protein [Polyangiaceae bacterium]